MMRRGTHQAKKHHGAPKPPADLLVCFPTRAHLTIKPKQICSPARLSDPTSHRSKHLTKLSSARFRTETSSPVSWAKDKRAGLDGSEPSSPKVTCAGQIKVRRKSADSSWQSVMEEIERIHIKNKRQKKKRASWGDALGFKKEVMQFLTCLRTIKLDFRCFGAMPDCSDISSDEEDEDEEEDHEHGKDEINQLNSEEEEDKSSGTKWVVFLQENQDTREPVITNHVDQESESLPVAPPPNALLLMRCRSAPAKSWLETRAREIVEQEERDTKAQQQQQENEQEEDKEEMFEKTETEENQKKKKKLRDYLVVMDYDTDFYKLSNDIANETWVVGSINPSNPFSRSRSWKR